VRKYVAVLSLCVVATLAVQGQAPNGAAGKDWAYPLGDQGAQRYSSLNQITTANVGKLTRAWTFHTGAGRFSFPPMIVDSVIYFSAPNGIFAVDAVKGTLIWKYPEGPIVPASAATLAAAAAVAESGERWAPLWHQL